MNEHPLYTYLMAQGELGGVEVVVPFCEPLSEPEFTEFKNLQNERPTSQDDSLWKDARNLGDFYGALKKHSIYTKGMRGLSFWEPKGIKRDVPLLLLFHSPLELTPEARGILERLFKKLEIDLNGCAFLSF